MAPLPHSAYMYVDAQYISTTLRDRGQSPWFAPFNLFKYRFHSPASMPFHVDRMFFYDALWGEELSNAKDKIKRDNQRKYLEQIESINFVEVRTGFIRAGQKPRKREQKGVDVQITVDALVAATNRLTDAIILVSGDADFCPLADAVRRTGTFFFVAGFETKLPDELRYAADAVGFLPLDNWPELTAFAPINEAQDQPS